MSEKRLRDRVALVAGASSGIGLETARQLAARGAAVALVARRAESLQALQQEIIEAGGKARYFVADLARETAARAAAEAVLDQFGRIDILVNSAGIIRPGALAAASIEDIDATIGANLLAPMYLSKAVLPGMIDRGDGHIVTVSSNAAKLPGTEANNAYSASKHGVTGFSNSLRKEVAPHGIRVTLVEPGTTETDIASSIADPQRREAMDRHLHGANVMQAADVAAAICFALVQHPRVNVDEIWLTPTRA